MKRRATRRSLAVKPRSSPAMQRTASETTSHMPMPGKHASASAALAKTSARTAGIHHRRSERIRRPTTPPASSGPAVSRNARTSVRQRGGGSVTVSDVSPQRAARPAYSGSTRVFVESRSAVRIASRISSEGRPRSIARTTGPTVRLRISAADRRASGRSTCLPAREDRGVRLRSSRRCQWPRPDMPGRSRTYPSTQMRLPVEELAPTQPTARRRGMPPPKQWRHAGARERIPLVLDVQLDREARWARETVRGRSIAHVVPPRRCSLTTTLHVPSGASTSTMS